MHPVSLVECDLLPRHASLRLYDNEVAPFASEVYFHWQVCEEREDRRGRREHPCLSLIDEDEVADDYV